MTEFFSQNNISQSIVDVLSNNSGMTDNQDALVVREALYFLSGNGSQVDDNAQLTIPLVSRMFNNLLKEFRPPYTKDNIDQLAAIIYRILMEYRLSIVGEAHRDVVTFMDSIENRMNTLEASALGSIQDSQRSMPIKLLKRMLATEEISALRNVGAFSGSIQSKIDSWQAKLDAQQAAAEQLGAMFERHASVANFANLHEGFSDMLDKVNDELSNAQKGIWFFGFLLLLPAALEIYYVATYINAKEVPPLHLLAITAGGTLTLTLLILYFFRIVLRKADSCRAQLMQINLRMSLCRFIQPYTDYSKDIRDKHSDTFAKFESLIFSGIVGTTDKLPSTFDGLDHISGLIKSFKGEK